MRALWSHFSAISNCKLSPRIRRISAANLTSNRNLSSISSTEDPELRDLVGFLESLKNYERSGVPQGAGTDSGDGFDLGRMKRLMLRLRNPHSKYKVRLTNRAVVVHVAGTKGKGSTCAFLSNILRAGGYSVGCYSSPHILSIKERISCNGHPVSASTLNDLFYSIKPIIDQSIQDENAHTKESARALKEMIKKDFAEKRLVFVVAMASDKDHVSFAKELLSGLKPEAVILTEADIGGGKVRSTACAVLKELWIKAADELGLGSLEASKNKTVFGSLKLAYKFLSNDTSSSDSGMVIVTGSLHFVSSVLASLQH